MQKIMEKNNLVREASVEQLDDRSRTFSSETAIQPKNSKEQRQARGNKMEASISESSFNEKRMASYSALKS